MTFGLIQCKFQVFRGLYHPLLPMRKAGKLLLALSPTCVEEKLAKQLYDRSCMCPNSDAGGAFTGIWWLRNSSWYSSMVIKSYVFMKPHTHASYMCINTAIKDEMESDGWPSTNVAQDPDPQADYLQH